MVGILILVVYFLGIGYTIGDYTQAKKYYTFDGIRPKIDIVIWLLFVFVLSPAFLLIDLGQVLYNLKNKEND
jgi:hypothetical protein